LHRIFRGIIVGFGNVAVCSHLPVWSTFPDAEICGVVEPDDSRKPVIQEKLPRVPVYPDLDEALKRLKPDFVDVCSPSGLHFDHVMTACRHEVAVLCEKPLVTSLEQLHTLEEYVRDRKARVFTVHNWKHSPQWKLLYQMVRKGLLGEVKKVEIEVLRPPNSGGGVTGWRQDMSLAGGGIIIDHGWHAFYLLMGLLKCSPQSLSCRMDFTCRDSCALDDQVWLELHYPEALASVHLTWRADRRGNRGMVVGTQGVVEINDDHLVLRVIGQSPETVVFEQALSASSHHPAWTKPVLEEFMEVMRGAAPYSEDNFTEAAWCTRLISLAYLSNEQGSADLDVALMCCQNLLPKK
jgi:predicted dehydrogenase